MTRAPTPSPAQPFLSRLLRDRSGNTLAIVAAATAPLLAIAGGAVDMGRGYVSETRLQQACDAGVLAARKKLGSDLPPSDELLAEMRDVGNQFFDLNFAEGRFGSRDREFEMTLEEDFAVTGRASLNLPTAIMKVFGHDLMPISVTCQSRMNFTNLDVMMVLDTTGSMRHTNDGDSMSRIDTMRSVIKGFHGNLEASKSPDTRVRYGFVPYSTNVNAGGILADSWVVNNWTYQTRELESTASDESTRTYDANWQKVSGEREGWEEVSTYAATFYPGTAAPVGSSGDETPGGGTADSYKCEGSQPANTAVSSYEKLGETSEPFAGPPVGTRLIESWRRTTNGSWFRTRLEGSTCIVEELENEDYVETYDRITDPKETTTTTWRYAPLARSVTNWRSETSGCMEEIQTIEVADYESVDLSQALDLDIDHVPGSDDAGKWRPMYNDVIFARSLDGNGNGSFTPEEVSSTATFAKTGNWWMSSCPAPVSKLAPMTASEVSSYLDLLSPAGATYHDIGMLWGARLLSQDGLFASENVDVSGEKPTSRHLIFLTDGQTEPYDVAYGAYGIEPLDRRRWDPATSVRSLVETVEARFVFACKELKRKNVTVWVIAFGTSVNPAMTECAGEGRTFEASDADELDETFDTIARSMGDLRMSK